MTNPNSMKYVVDTVEKEGLDYAMVHYSDYAEFTNEKFHELRRAYLEARRALADFIGVE